MFKNTFMKFGKGLSLLAIVISAPMLQGCDAGDVLDVIDAIVTDPYRCDYGYQKVCHAYRDRHGRRWEECRQQYTGCYDSRHFAGDGEIGDLADKNTGKIAI